MENWDKCSREAGSYKSSYSVSSKFGKECDLSGGGKTSLFEDEQKWLSCSSQTTTTGDQILNKLLKNYPHEYLVHEFNFEKEILKYCSKKFSTPVLFTLELRRN